MAEHSAIEWTDATFNPWIGCTKVSAACDHCYAETLSKARLGVRWGAGQPRRRTTAENWKQPLRWNRKAEKEGRRMRVFCASLADVFDAEVPDEWRDELFALIAMTPHLDWLLLTKRPKVAHDYITRQTKDNAEAVRVMLTAHYAPKGKWCEQIAWPLPNVWLGATVEYQAMAEARIPRLLATPAAKRFLSMEPLLGPVDLTRIPWRFNGFSGETVKTVNALTGNITINDPVFGGGGGVIGLDWIIAGGESGANARPSHPDWFRSLRDQCAAAGVPFLFKQWGEWWPWTAPLDGSVLGSDHGPPPDRVPSAPVAGDSRVHWWALPDDDHLQPFSYRIGKKAAGRLLDGTLHDGIPQPQKKL